MKSFTELLSSGTAIAAAAVLSAGLVLAGTVATDSRHGHGHGNGQGNKPTTAESIYLDEVKDYGVCRGTDAACYNDWGNGWKDGEAKRILIWSRTAGPRHAHLGTPLGPGLNPPLNADNVAQAGLKAWAAERGIAADYTEDLAAFTRLGSYQAVVFLGSNRDTLDDPAQTTLMQYVRGGGGFVGIHNAFGAEYHWEWYEGLLGGANFYDHAPNRPGTVETINRKDVSTTSLPRKWAFTDEWYNLVPYPSYVNVLLEVDPKTSLNGRATGHPGHGEQHAVSWCQYYDGGKSWLTTLGHDVAVWTDTPIAGDDFFKEHVLSGLESAMGVKPFCAV